MYSAIFLARRNMRARRWRTLLTLLGIVLGVAVVLAIQITNQTTLDSLRRVFDRTTGRASLVIIPVNEERQPLDASVLGKVERESGVQAAVPSLLIRTLLASDAASWQIAFNMSGIAAGNFFQLYGIDPELDPQVRVYALSLGRMPETDKYEVAIPEKTAQEKDLQIGQDLVFLTPEGLGRLEIVGLLAGEGVGLLNDGMVGFAPIHVVQDLYARGGEYDEIALQVVQPVAESPGALEALKAALSQRLGKDSQVAYPASRGQLISQMLATYQLGLTFFSLIAIFVGAFLIYNTFSMTVVERTRETGMLRAVGMSRRQVLGMVLAEAGLLSIVGSVIGLAAGYWLALGLVRLLGNLVTAEQGVLRLTWPGLLQGLAVGVGVTLAASLLPALQAARLSPLEALRARSRSTSRPNPALGVAGIFLMLVGWLASFRFPWPKELLFYGGNFALVCFFLGATLTVGLAVGLLERLTRPLALWLYRNEGALGSANVRRAVGRTTLTVASLMVALTMIISIESLAFSYKSDLNQWVDNALGGDLYVRAPLPMRESFASQLRSVPGVQTVTPARVLTVKAASGSLPAVQDSDFQFFYEALDPATFRQIGDMEFAANQGDPEASWRRLSQGRAIFISNMVADRYDLHQGDQLVLLTRRGEQPFYIAAEVTDFGGQGQVIYGTYDDMHRWFNEQGVDRFTLNLTPGSSVDAVSQEIERRYKDSQNLSLQTTQAFKKSILDLVNQSFRLFDVLNLIAVIIGALSVINTLTMNVIERQREIGGLRSLGMRRRQVLRMVLAESLALGLMGGAYGFVIGYFIAQVVILGTNMMAGYDLVYQFTPKPYLIGALIALVFVQAAAIYPARRAAQVNIIEAIKHE